MKRKGQASSEYMLIVVGVLFFVLIFIFVNRNFLFNPGARQVVSQGSLIQQQMGALSKALNVGKPISVREPKVYSGFVSFPVNFSFQVNKCLERSELWTDDDDNYQLRETLNKEQLPLNGLVNFSYQIEREVEFTYDVVVTPCDEDAVRDNGVVIGVSHGGLQGGWFDGFFHVNFNAFLSSQGGVVEVVRLNAVAPNDARYTNAYQAFLDQGNQISGRAPVQVANLSSFVSNVGWYCENGFPIGIVDVSVQGENLVSVTARCHAGRQVLPEITRNIDRAREYTLVVLGQGLGENVEVTCSSTACNATECKPGRINRSTRTCRIQAPAPQPVQYSVAVDRVNEGFADQILFTINSEEDLEFGTTLIYTAFDRGTNQEFEQRDNLGQRRRGQNNYVVQRPANIGRQSNYVIEICNNERCVNSNN